MPGILLPHRGRMPKVAASAFVAETAVLIGDVEVGEGASIWYGCVLRGDVNRIRVGEGTNLQDGTVVHGNHDPAGDYRETGGGMPTLIGARVTVGHMALIHACTVEDEAFIGMRSIVMDGALVEKGGMLAAGALLTPGKRVESGQLWAGSPARFLRSLTAEEQGEGAYLSKLYAELAVEYRKERSEPR